MKYLDPDGRTMGDYLQALRNAPDPRSYENVVKNAKSYIAFGKATIDYNDNCRLTSFGKIVAFGDLCDHFDLLYEIGRNDYSVTQWKYNNGKEDISHLKKLTYEKTFCTYSDSAAFNISASYGFGPNAGFLGISVGATITDDAIFPVIGIGVSTTGFGVSATYLGNNGVSTGVDLNIQGSFLLHGNLNNLKLDGVGTPGASVTLDFTLFGVSY